MQKVRAMVQVRAPWGGVSRCYRTRISLGDTYANNDLPRAHGDKGHDGHGAGCERKDHVEYPVGETELALLITLMVRVCVLALGCYGPPVVAAEADQAAG